MVITSVDLLRSFVQLTKYTVFASSISIIRSPARWVFYSSPFRHPCSCSSTVLLPWPSDPPFNHWMPSTLPHHQKKKRKKKEKLPRSFRAASTPATNTATSPFRPLARPRPASAPTTSAASSFPAPRAAYSRPAPPAAPQAAAAWPCSAAPSIPATSLAGVLRRPARRVQPPRSPTRRSSRAAVSSHYSVRQTPPPSPPSSCPDEDDGSDGGSAGAGAPGRGARAGVRGVAARRAAPDPPAPGAGVPGAPHQRARARGAGRARRPVRLARRSDGCRGHRRRRRLGPRVRAPGRHGRAPSPGLFFFLCTDQSLLQFMHCILCFSSLDRSIDRMPPRCRMPFLSVSSLRTSYSSRIMRSLLFIMQSLLY